MFILAVLLVITLGTPLTRDVRSLTKSWTFPSHDVRDDVRASQQRCFVVVRTLARAPTVVRNDTGAIFTSPCCYFDNNACQPWTSLSFSVFRTQFYFFSSRQWMTFSVIEILILLLIIY